MLQIRQNVAGKDGCGQLGRSFSSTKWVNCTQVDMQDLDPPEAFVVLCVNEKSPIQALARSQLAFPRSAPPATSATERRAFSLRSTSPTAPSFQAWIGVTGPLSSRSSRIDSKVPEGLEVHLVFDNYGTHKTRL